MLNLDDLKFRPFRILQDDGPRQAYVRSTAKATTEDGTPKIGLDALKGLHYGQRKLLLSEIEFLTGILRTKVMQSASRVVVVYAGAANGSHLPLLFEMFPAVKWVLVDPAPFCAPVCKLAEEADSPILEIVNGYCTAELCQGLREKYITVDGTHFALISDIRSGNPPSMGNKAATEMIIRDNDLQKSFTDTLRPDVAMYKYHPPYPRVTDTSSPFFDPNDDTPDAIEYYEGDPLLGVWPPKSSSEIRLVVKNPATAPKMRQWDCKAFEELCYHHNVTGSRFKKDTEAEMAICSDYLQWKKGTEAVGDDEVMALSNEISARLKFPKFTPGEGFVFDKLFAKAEDADEDDDFLMIPGTRSIAYRFSEDNARLCALLYDADAIAYFTSEWRSAITAEAVRAAISSRTEHPVKDDADGPQAGDLPRKFWELATFKRLNSFYSVQMPKRDNAGGRGRGGSRGGDRGRGRGGNRGGGDRGRGRGRGNWDGARGRGGGRAGVGAKRSHDVAESTD